MLTISLTAAVLAMAAPVGWAAGGVSSAAQARGHDQSEALTARRKGELLSIAEIERRIVPAMRPAQYIGFVYDAAGAVYTLKFLRDGNVIWVLVDGRSGMVLGRAGG